MNKTIFLLGAVLVSGAAFGADPMYVRGAFNGWGTDNVLADNGGGAYETEIVLAPGNHAFKLGSKDWSAEWVIDPAASVQAAPGTVYKMATRPGPEDFLFVKRAGAYRFSVDASARTLRIVRLADVPAAAVDPHKGRTVAMTFATYDGGQETARFSASDAGAPLRDYVQSTTQQLRDPGPQFVRYRESADLPTVRSGNLAFDALFALAGAEMKQDSVREIRDGNYNGGAAIPCDCFETGERWHYVWTRDLSYAADLGLAMLDPVRVMHSLDFKLSHFRPGLGPADALQIIQDTGSGGSWPVSTDRVAWAFGAEQTLKMLPDAERRMFAPRALKALAGTIENDRLAAYDATDGLYTGEQSFLDWRDQSYAAWVTGDLASLASSKALSTNVAHYKALTLAAKLAREQGQPALAKKYGTWALDLKRAINRRLWLADEGMYSSLTAPHFDGAPLHKFDWLGQSLAIVTGIASAERARSILAHYPHGPMGAPVIYPQQPGMPVYHNRAVWPFVTAYGLKATASAGNVSVADAAYQSLMRGAALNLSNMENLEWLSGQPLLLDEKHPSLTGPVIDSKRQLWSVGAYLGMVIENVFGITAADGGIDIKPFITGRLRRDTFGGSDAIALRGLRLRGKTIGVTITLPPVSQTDGFYLVDEVRVNGAKASQHIAWDSLPADSAIEVRLGQLTPGQHAIRRVAADPYDASGSVFGPPEPRIADFARDASGKVSFVIDGGAGAVYNVYKDGMLAAANLPAGTWSDRGAASCYSVEAVDPTSGNRSHHSAARCAGDAIFETSRLKDWGKPDDTFAVNGIEVPVAGDYQVQIHYRNSANQINLGISGGVKWLAVKDMAGRVLARHVIQLPHTRTENAGTPAWSTPLAVRLPRGKIQLELTDFYNMSYLQSNSTFGAAGGAAGASNRFDIYGVRLLKVK